MPIAKPLANARVNGKSLTAPHIREKEPDEWNPAQNNQSQPCAW